MISHAIAARFYDCEFQTADSALHERAHAGDADALRELIAQEKYKSELDKRNHLGCTPLRLAATGGHVEAAKVLLEAGAAVDIVDVKGQTPLFVAVKNNHYDCARMLLMYKADTEGSEDNVASPLYTAAMNGYVNMVKLLIEFGANIASPNVRVLRAFSMDPTQIALAYQEFNCVKLLLRAQSKSLPQPNERDTTPLFHIAIKQKCGVQFLHLLHEFGISVYKADSQGKFPWQHDVSGYPEEERERILQYLHYIRECPRGLKSQCRLCITQNLRRENKLTGLDSLCLPKTLIRYLMYEDVTRFTQTTENSWGP